jgi:hypothetical protein
VAEAVDNQEGSLRQLARRFCVSVTFITRLLGRRRQTGSLERFTVGLHTNPRLGVGPRGPSVPRWLAGRDPQPSHRT